MSDEQAPGRTPAKSMGDVLGDVGIVDRPSPPLLVFCSHSDVDDALCAELDNHLKPLQREGISFWHRGHLRAGAERIQIARSRLDQADVILLLLSSDFFASDDCHGEMLRAMARAATGTWAIPVIVRAVDWSHSVLAELKPLPSDRNAVTSWTNRDEAWTNVAVGVREVIDRLRGGRAA
jgi:hypothetical protein